MTNANAQVRQFDSAAAPSEYTERVIMITPTFRDPKGNSDAFNARFQGLISLYHQFQEQDYPEHLMELRIADSSADPHPFFMMLKDPRVKYLHLPDRSRELKSALEEKYPSASRFLLTNEDLQAHEHRSKIEALQDFCSKKIDPISSRMIPSIKDPMDIPRPSIGMKRNILCGLPFGTTDEAHAPKPDIIIAMDDDDWRSPNYTKEMVDHLQDAGWTKLVNYHLAILGEGEGRSIFWGSKEFSKVDKSENLPGLNFSNVAMVFNAATGLAAAKPEEAFNSPRWHPLSTDGTVHALRYAAWERTVELFGGYQPVSYNEDTLMFEALQLLGNMERREDVCRHPLILRGLMDGRVYAAEELAADKAKGPIKFNPNFENNGIFARLCAANVSPVAFSKMVSDAEVPDKMRHAFDFLVTPNSNVTVSIPNPANDHLSHRDVS